MTSTLVKLLASLFGWGGGSWFIPLAEVRDWRTERSKHLCWKQEGKKSSDTCHAPHPARQPLMAHISFKLAARRTQARLQVEPLGQPTVLLPWAKLSHAPSSCCLPPPNISEAKVLFKQGWSIWGQRKEEGEELWKQIRKSEGSSLPLGFPTISCPSPCCPSLSPNPPGSGYQEVTLVRAGYASSQQKTFPKLLII